jgi:hypothetical protein
MAIVYIVSKSNHDFSKAEHFGEIRYLSEGVVNRYHVNNMIRQFTEALKDSNEEDYILPCGLSMMNSIACSIFVLKHKRLNLLLFKSGKYIERNVVFEEK